MADVDLDLKRKEALLGYLREVARNLIQRGIIRNRVHGQSFIEILQQEPSVVFSSILRDLSDAGLSLKNEIVGGMFDAAKSALGDFLFGSNTKAKR